VLDGAFMIPYVMPGIVIGIAYIAAFNTGPIVLTAPRRSSCSRSNPPPAVLPSAPPRRPSARFRQHGGSGRVAWLLPAPGLPAHHRAAHRSRIIAGGMLSFVTAINELSSSLVLYVGSTMTCRFASTC